jgi:tetratricopeptide (TPR) repeat protein
MSSSHPYEKLFLQAEQLLELDKFVQAEKKYKEYLSYNPMDRLARFGYIRSLIGQDKVRESQHEIAAALKDFPDGDEFIFLKFVIYFDTNRFAQAIEAGNEYLKFNPDHATTHAFLAQAYLHEKKADKAKHHATTALRINPENVHAKQAHASVLLDGNNHDEAIKLYLDAVRADPNDANNHIYLANAYYHDGKNKEALDALRTALRLNPENKEAINTYIQYRSTTNPLLWILYKYRVFLGKIGGVGRGLLLLLFILTPIGKVVGFSIIILWIVEMLVIFALKREWIT